MTTLLKQLRTELNVVFDRYDQMQHVTTVQNAEYIANIKNKIKTATSAFKLIAELPTEIKKLDTKFWSFLAFVDDPVRDLKEGIEKVLKQKKYQRQNVLEVESAELQEANYLLQQRLTSLEQMIERKYSLSRPVNNSDTIPDQTAQDELEACLRAEIEQEVSQEVEDLKQQLLRERQETKRWQLKCDVYQKQTHTTIKEKDACQQKLTDTETKLTATEGKLSQAETEIARLTQENQRLKQLLDAKQKNPFSNAAKSEDKPSNSNANNSISLNSF